MNRIFEIGEKIICIDSKGVELVEGKTYIVTGFDYCPYCHNTAVCVGIKQSRKYSGLVHCAQCDKSFEDKTTEESFKQSRFIRPDEDQCLEKEISNALNENLKIKI